MARKKPDPERVRNRMFAYWDRVFDEDVESLTARTLLERTEDPQSIFHDEEFLNQLIDDMERDKKVKNTRHIVREDGQ